MPIPKLLFIPITSTKGLTRTACVRS